MRLKKADFINCGSYYGYKECYYIKGLRIHVDEQNIIIDMSGQGCRLLESLYENKLNWIDFIGIFLSTEGSHLSRLDIAGDDKPEAGESPILSIKVIEKHAKQNRYISLAKRVMWIGGAEENIMFGSPSSDRRLRIYNKALERTHAGKQYNGHWIRSELQMRNDNALSFYMKALELGSIGLAYSGMMYDYLRFTNDVNEGINTNRMTVCKWWKKFLGTSKKEKGFKVGGLEYNLQTLENVLFKQCASSLKAYMIAKKGDLTELFQAVQDSKLNKEQQFLVDTLPLIKKMKHDYLGGYNDIMKENDYINSEIKGKGIE